MRIVPWNIEGMPQGKITREQFRATVLNKACFVGCVPRSQTQSAITDFLCQLRLKYEHAPWILGLFRVWRSGHDYRVAVVPIQEVEAAIRAARASQLDVEEYRQRKPFPGKLYCLSLRCLVVV